MQNKILLYLLAFMSLILIFLSINYIKISNSNESNSKILNNKIDSLENRYKLLDKRFTDEIYFSLNDNQEALEHFARSKYCLEPSIDCHRSCRTFLME